jgi:hypothetical protein
MSFLSWALVKLFLVQYHWGCLSSAYEFLFMLSLYYHFDEEILPTGSHGDGHPSNIDTPLVEWGSGIRSPKFLTYTEKLDDGFRFVDDHKHDTPTQDWTLEGFERVDVNQADIASLMVSYEFPICKTYSCFFFDYI